MPLRTLDSRVNVCDACLSRLYLSHDSFVCAWHDSFICVWCHAHINESCHAHTNESCHTYKRDKQAPHTLTRESRVRRGIILWKNFTKETYDSHLLKRPIKATYKRDLHKRLGLPSRHTHVTHTSHTWHTHVTHRSHTWHTQTSESRERGGESWFSLFPTPAAFPFCTAQLYTLRHLYKFGEVLYLYDTTKDHFCNSVWYFDRIKTTNPTKRIGGVGMRRDVMHI